MPRRFPKRRVSGFRRRFTRRQATRRITPQGAGRWSVCHFNLQFQQGISSDVFGEVAVIELLRTKQRYGDLDTAEPGEAGIIRFQEHYHRGIDVLAIEYDWAVIPLFTPQSDVSQAMPLSMWLCTQRLDPDGVPTFANGNFNFMAQTQPPIGILPSDSTEEWQFPARTYRKHHVLLGIGANNDSISQNAATNTTRGRERVRLRTRIDDSHGLYFTTWGRHSQPAETKPVVWSWHGTLWYRMVQ